MTLIAFFFCIAFIYASVGFGGGSSYIALMVFCAFDAMTIKNTALLCNIVVVTSGTYLFWKKDILDIKKITPLVLSSIPMAFFGATLRISEKNYFILLGISLILAAISLLATSFFLFKDKEILIKKNTQNIDNQIFIKNNLFNIFLGASIGFLSGIVGIGGGIFLAPILHFMQWDTPRKIAATASFFILINSIAGLFGNAFAFAKNIDYQFIMPLLLAVFIGGQLGTRSNFRFLNPIWIQRLTALLVLFAGLEIIRNV